MSKRFLLITIFFTYGVCKAQNIVPNGNFETYISCPTMVTQIALATPWLNPSIGGLTLPGSPDYFNQCASGSVSVPYNFFGYQTAHSGKGYSGICLWSGEPPEVREYLEVPINSLTSGITYYFQMYINLANNCQHSTDAVGVYFSDTSIINIPNYYPLPFIPQINNVSGNYLDTLNWKIVSGSYTALGGESFLLIGNFNADSTTSAPLVNSSAQFNSAYSYIDDVSLTICTGILNESMFVSYVCFFTYLSKSFFKSINNHNKNIRNS